MPASAERLVVSDANVDSVKPDDSDEAVVCLMATHSDDAKQQSRTQASQKKWFIDSGATAHMCNDKESFVDIHEVDPFNVAMGDKSKAQACCCGFVDVILYVGEKPAHYTLSYVPFVPNLNFNLVWTAVMDKHGYKIVFENCMCRVFKNGRVIAEGERRKSLYYLRTTTHSPDHTDHTDHTVLVTYINLWHQRLGHAHVDGIRNMACHGVVRGLDSTLTGEVHACNTNVHSKITRAPVPKQGVTRLRYPGPRTH